MSEPRFRRIEARALIPVGQAPTVDGAAVLVRDELVVAAGRALDVARDTPAHAEVVDLGEVALIPGLINAHTHLELSGLSAHVRPEGDYVDWVRELVRAREGIELASLRDAIRDALDRLRASGVAAVGDVSNTGASIDALSASGFDAVVFYEVLGLDPARVDAIVAEAEQRADALERRARALGGRLRVVPSPHAPHTASEELLVRLTRIARGRPSSLHVAESAAEVERFRTGGGALTAFLRERAFEPAGWCAPGVSPVEWLASTGFLGPETLVVHAVHVDTSDLDRLRAAGATVVTCPRSNERLGVGLAPVPAMLDRGIPVAIGTDSLASAPDLDVLSELACLARLHPELSPARALEIATVAGARALGLGDVLGTIEPGKRAALACVEIPEGARSADSISGAIVSAEQPSRRVELSPTEDR